MVLSQAVKRVGKGEEDDSSYCWGEAMDGVAGVSPSRSHVALSIHADVFGNYNKVMHPKTSPSMYRFIQENYMYVLLGTCQYRHMAASGSSSAPSR